MPWGEFKLSELNLDLQNVRTGNQPDQRSAIRALIEDQKQKLVNLAIDLLDVGPSPGEPIWVTPDIHEPGLHVVLEGNRRVCALKLMENPRLADGTDLAAPFSRLAADFTSKPIRTLEAALFATREDAKPFIDRRHMGAASGVALQRWHSLAKERSQPGWSGRIRRSLLALDYLDDGTDEFEEVGNVIEKKSTTVDRVLNNPAMKSALGIDINTKTSSITFSDNDEIKGRRLLRRIITEMAKPEFKFSKIRDVEDRVRFIQSFGEGVSVKEPDNNAKIKHGHETQDSENPPQGPKKGRLNDTTRTTLAPRTGPRTLGQVPGVRLNRIYRECRETRLSGSENSAALLLRVFIELSTEAFLIEKNIELPRTLSVKKGKADWSDVGISLADKINTAMPLIDTTPRTRKRLKKARVALANSHMNGSIDTLHAYFHNFDMNPGAPELRDAWDTWEHYLELLHSARR